MGKVIWDALLDLVPFVKFKKREKYPWSSVTSSKVAGWSQQLYYFTRSNTPECLSRSLNCKNRGESRKASLILADLSNMTQSSNYSPPS